MQANKFCSLLKNVDLSVCNQTSTEIAGVDGEIVLVRVLDINSNYNNLELNTGKIVPLESGDIVAGVLGQRKALHGIIGGIPKTISPGDILDMLNIAGVVGKASSWNKDLVDFPVKVEILASYRNGDKNLNIKDYEISSIQSDSITKIIAVWGTCMNTGKTTVAKELIRLLTTLENYHINAAKLTGVATQRDILAMKQAGARNVLSFLDLGLTSTISDNGVVVPVAMKILHALSVSKPHYLVVEMGDGMIGWYGVEKLLKSQEFMNNIIFNVACAQDLVGAKGLVDIFQEHHRSIDFFAGPVTNNTAGTDYIEDIFSIPAQDLRRDKEKLFEAFYKKRILTSK